MTDLPQVLVVLEPAYDNDAAEATRLLQSACELFAFAIEPYTVSPVEVVHAFLNDIYENIPPNGFVLWVDPVDAPTAWSRCPEPRRRLLEKRTLLVDVSDHDIDCMISVGQFPAFVRSRSYEYWRSDLYRKSSMIGLAKAAAHLPTRYDIKPIERTGYCQIFNHDGRQLPMMIVDYLTACLRTDQPVTNER